MTKEAPVVHAIVADGRSGRNRNSQRPRPRGPIIVADGRSGRNRNVRLRTCISLVGGFDKSVGFPRGPSGFRLPPE